MANILDLPADVLMTILKWLDFADIRSVMVTCKALLSLILNENSIWRNLYRKKLIVLDKLDDNVFKSWYNLCRISKNWRNGIYIKKVIIQHKVNYMPWLVQHGDTLLLSTGSQLQCYYIQKAGLPACKESQWKLDIPKVKRHDVRTNDISRFIVKDNLLLCGNRDGCIAVYQINNIKQRPKLLCHIKDCHENGHAEVSAVEVINTKDKPYAVTVSCGSSQLCFWPISEEDIVNRYKTGYKGCDTNNYTDNVTICQNVSMRCLTANSAGDKLAMGPDGNCKPLLLDVTTGKLLMSVSSWNRKQAIRDIQWHNQNTLGFVTHSGMLQCIDTRTEQMIYETADPFQAALYCLKTNGQNAILVGSSENSRCVLFDSRNPKHHVQMYFAQTKPSPIYSLDFDSTRLTTAADRSVTTLNFNVNAATTKSKDYSHIFEVVNR